MSVEKDAREKMAVSTSWSLLLLPFHLLPVCCEGLGPLLAKNGQNVVFSWPLPHSVGDTTMVIAFNKPHNSVFYTSTLSSHVVVDHNYEDRVNVSEGLQSGFVQFSLYNVTSRDAGRYLCVTGFLDDDVLTDCGQTLVVIDPPTEATVTALATPVTGSPLTLRCNATSVSTPPDHGLTMKCRWFESDEWMEKTVFTSDEELDVSIDNNISDTGSGHTDVSSREDNSDCGELKFDSVARSDEGKRFACRASEGLDLWSAISRPYIVTPEWAPLKSDLSLIPSATSLAVTVGQWASSTCVAVCRPPCDLVWQMMLANNQTVSITTDPTLTFAHVDWEHDGHYRCVASNAHGTNFITWSLAVQDPPRTWLSSKSHIIIVVVIATVGLALGMTGVAYMVVACRRRSTPVVWPHQKRNSDVVPLSHTTHSDMVSYI